MQGTWVPSLVRNAATKSSHALRPGTVKQINKLKKKKKEYLGETPIPNTNPTVLPNIHSIPSRHKRNSHPPSLGKENSSSMPAFNILHIAQAAALPNPGQRETQGPTEWRQGNPQHHVPGNPTPRVQSPGYPEPRPSLDEKGAHCGLQGEPRQRPPSIREALTALEEAVVCPPPSTGIVESTRHPSWARLPGLWLTHWGNLPYLSIHPEGQA